MTIKRIFFLFGVSLILSSCDRDQLQVTNENPRPFEQNQSLQKMKKDSLNLNEEVNPSELEVSIDPNDEGPKVPPRK